MAPYNRHLTFTITIIVYLLTYFIVFANSRFDRNQKVIYKLSVFYSDESGNVDAYLSNAVDIVNRKLLHNTFKFEYYAYKVDPYNTFRMSKFLCSDLNDGRIAIIGIGNNPTLDHLQSITMSLDVPYIAIKWENYEQNYNYDDDEDDLNYDPNPAPIKSLNIHTPSQKIIRGIIDLVNYYKWEDVTVLYQETLGLDRIQELVRMPNTFIDNKLRLQVRQLISNMSEWRFLLKDVKLSGTSHIIVDIETKYLNTFVQQASEVGLMTLYFNFVFTSLDLSVLSYAPPANITGFQVYRPNDPQIKSLLAEWNLKNVLLQKPVLNYLPSEAAMIIDALQLLTFTIEEHDLTNSLALTTSTVSCQKETPWKFGPTFLNYLKNANFTGVSGQVSFNSRTGQRNNTFLYIVDMTKNGVDLVGYWEDAKNYNQSIHIVRSYTIEYDQVREKLSKELIVTTRLEDPYVMRKQVTNNEKLYGNDRYEGYCIDLLDEIAKICNFTYTIRLVEDGLYGTIGPDGKWNGLVKELIDKKADLAVAALTINYQREQVIDFTKPFLNLGISILFKRPSKNAPELFSFLSPLSVHVWLYMIAAYLGVSFMLVLLARFSPYEWQNPHPCEPESGIVENQFTILNSLWFTIGSLMQQGTDINPKSPSIRLISCVWAFFTLILISSYTANLAAFLTVQRMQTPIENADDLSRQVDIKYGTLTGGSTQTFFRESKIQTYERMWNFMNSNPDVFVNSTEAGLKRVKESKYAFLLESTMNEYARQRDCDLMQVGGLLDSKGYGIGTPTGSPWRDEISNSILKLQEDGKLQMFFTKWWKQKGALTCDNVDDKKKDSANELGLANVGGVFVVLVIGLSLSFIVALLEFIWKARQTSDEQITVKQQIIRDCKFALCHYNKSKKSSLMHFAKLNLNNVIKIIPPSSSSAGLETSIDKQADMIDSVMPLSSYSLTSLPKDGYETNDDVLNTKKVRLRKNPPQEQHKYLKCRTSDDLDDEQMMNNHLV